MTKKYLYCLAVILAGCFGACKKPDFEAQQQEKAHLRNAGDFIRNNFAFSLFAAAIEKAGLMDTLNNPNAAYTILAPQNADFNADSIMKPADLDAWGVDSLRFFVKNHIVVGKLFFSDIPTNPDNQYLNLNGLAVYFSKPPAVNAPATMLVNGIRVAETDIALANGIVHVIDGLMKESRSTVQDFLTSRPDLSLLVAGLKKYNLWDGLRTASNVTVFAPLNGSLEGVGLSADNINTMDITKYKPVLFGCYALPGHHIFLNDLYIVPAAALPLTDGYFLDLASATTGCAVKDAAGIYLGPLGNRIIPVVNRPELRYTPFLSANTTDYLFTNGIVHILSGALVLPDDVRR